MKKILFLIICLFFIQINIAQSLLKGQVVSENNEPLVGASIYFNNTSIGTISNDEGKFELKVPRGTYQLIISHLGFTTIEHQIDTDKISKPFLFKAQSKINKLEEVIVSSRKKKLLKSKESYFYKFKNAFIGRTDFAKNCKIENPEILEYFFDEKTVALEVEAIEPLKIYNKDLGYIIYYDLVHFKSTPKRIEYLGYTRYEELKGNKRKNKLWKKNRLKAYNGSRMHFLRSLILANSREEGFIVNQFERKKNKNFPTNEEIKFSRKIFKMYKDNRSPINFKKKIITPKTKLDSALLISRRAHQKKTKDSIIKTNLDYKDITYRINGKVYLKSKFPLKITYTKEKEEYNYRLGKHRLDKQTSNLILFESPVEILPFGQLVKPLAIMTEKYWGYEQFANALPLDYQPPKN